MSNFCIERALPNNKTIQHFEYFDYMKPLTISMSDKTKNIKLREKEKKFTSKENYFLSMFICAVAAKCTLYDHFYFVFSLHAICNSVPMWYTTQKELVFSIMCVSMLMYIGLAIDLHG